jgi:NNP family nitrate/nitrite transporter-like MFS transporter
VALVTGIAFLWISDDAPKGNYSELKERGQFPNPGVTVWSSWKRGSWNRNSWIMFLQHFSSSGVKHAMNQASALYFQDVFGMSTEASVAIASIFGWLNLFARGLGGCVSDWSNVRWGMRGRLWAHMGMIVTEGAMVFAFSHSHTLAGAIVCLVVFSLFVQLTEGTERREF